MLLVFCLLGPLAGDREKMLAIEALACCKRCFFLIQVLLVFCLLGPLAQDSGKMLAIEAPKGPKKGNRWTTDILMARCSQQEVFWEDIWKTHIFMAKCFQQNLLMRRRLDNTNIYGKKFSTKSLF